MSNLRDQILEIIERRDGSTAAYRADRIMAAVDADPIKGLAEKLSGQAVGIEQGISRLAMISFVAGEESSAWNGKPGPNQWVRYRGHHVSRGSYPDGIRYSVQFRSHVGEREATFEPSRRGTTAEAALLVIGDIDDLLDAVIEENGLPADAVARATLADFSATFDRGEVEP